MYEVGRVFPIHRKLNLLLGEFGRGGHQGWAAVTGAAADKAAWMSSGSNGIEFKETPNASSTAFTMAGAGPSIGSSPIPLAPYAPCMFPSSSKNTRIGGKSTEVGMM